MTTPKLSRLREMKDEEVVSSMTGFAKNTGPYIAGMLELKRRQERPNEIRGWIAVAISIVALAVSIFAISSAP